MGKLAWARCASGSGPGQGITKASARVLQEKPDLTAEKLQWLQRHDKECGGLYGLLPLCVGMPVRATEHLDRRRCILKGCRGTIVGWSACAGEPENNVVLWNKLPEVVYVRFDTTERWQIEGVPDSNVYPVATCKRVWFLDRQRRSPQLRVWRTQFPLAPAFAITAHVAQGQTIPEGVLTDLCVASAAILSQRMSLSRGCEGETTCSSIAPSTRLPSNEVLAWAGTFCCGSCAGIALIGKRS